MALIVNKIKVIVVAGLIAVVLCSCKENRTDFYIRRYLPLLNDFEIAKLKIVKINADPTYVKPYNIYFRFITDSNNTSRLVNLFQLYNSSLDTNYIRLIYPPQLLDAYYSMTSINEIRNSNLENNEWWWNEVKLIKKSGIKILTAPYLDDNKIGQLIPENTEANGRAAFCLIGQYCYIIIECWG
jgi:hypothetical protein